MTTGHTITGRREAVGCRRPARGMAMAIAIGAVIVAVTDVASSAEAGRPLPNGAVVASGLDNPRGLDWSHGRLYIAESGRGGDGACVPGIFAPEICFGRSGAVTEVTRTGRQHRIAERLPSIANPGGAFAYGPSDVSVEGGRVHVSVGGPNIAAWRDDPLTDASADKLGTVQLLRGRRTTTVADVAAFTDAEDPDGDPAESNTNSVLALPHRLLATDSAGNTLLDIGRRGDVQALHVFPDVVLADGTTTDAVATNLAVGPDGAIYVSTLSGFPFEVGLATVWRWDGVQATPYVTGLTTAVDLDFASDGSLYVVEMRGVNGRGPGRVLRIAPDGTRQRRGRRARLPDGHHRHRRRVLRDQPRHLTGDRRGAAVPTLTPARTAREPGSVRGRAATWKALAAVLGPPPSDGCQRMGPIDAQDRLVVRLLGDPEVSRGSTLVTAFESRRLQALLAFLIVGRARAIARQRLAFEFWPDSTDGQARTNLRQALHHLRHALGNAEQFVRDDGHCVQWRADGPATIDVVRFEPRRGSRVGVGRRGGAGAGGRRVPG